MTTRLLKHALRGEFLWSIGAKVHLIVQTARSLHEQTFMITVSDSRLVIVHGRDIGAKVTN